MSWGNEDDVYATVRKLMRPIRAKHKAEVARLKARIAKQDDIIEILRTRLDRALERADRASRAEGYRLEDATRGTGEMGQ